MEKLQGIGELNISLESLKGVLERFSHFELISTPKNSHPPLPVSAAATPTSSKSIQ